MEEKGKLLVSTKVSTGREMGSQISTVIFYGMGLWFLLNFDAMGEMGIDLFGDPAVGKVIGAALIGFLFVFPLIWLNRFKSYCEVYESGVVGITGSFSLINLFTKANNEKVFVSYEKISEVTESGETIFLYTENGKYEVLALKNRAEAVKEIKARIKSSK